ncbi:MAG: hypothetical protein IKE28_04435 [Solobacterium sp.]|nr:hypothetical protein [Solobacterium sp.]
MKKTVELITIGLLSFALAACGGSANSSTEATVTEDKPEETAETVADATQEGEGETGQEAEKTDEELIAETREQLVGEWYCPSIDLEHLIFNEDGTGHYTGLDKDNDFTYTTGIDRLDTPNNGRYIEDLMTITYDNGAVEDVIFLIGDEEISGYPGETKLMFQTTDHGGYSGVMNNFDVWVKKQD